jgi:hypothetical protein
MQVCYITSNISRLHVGTNADTVDIALLKENQAHLYRKVVVRVV